jgi:hypothetical protein
MACSAELRIWKDRDLVNKNLSTTKEYKLILNLLPRDVVLKKDIFELFRAQDPNITEQGFRRLLYKLEKGNYLLPLGAGLFAIQDPAERSSRQHFVPSLSPGVQNLSRELQTNFPYTEYVIWESNILRDWMIHQPTQSSIILEVENEATESVFNYLTNQNYQNIYYVPEKSMMIRYMKNFVNNTIILPKITESPKMKIRGVIYAKLEKILVDIFTDEERFYGYQGQEMIHIYENAFSKFWINPKTMFRYARRRKSALKLNEFINNQTKIEIPILTGL